ncbi:MarR family transcriptional regulator [uncultured Clostridium sp.]|uniref:MarR family winged helix-turn-helix transcriptional regulator n=1 Tax=uncultured Clostridium sp. TaxID=59620 RepID=UPI0026091D02|nr:MarR family transcriptional regulator [uncultured Clostridium sp.]
MRKIYSKEDQELYDELRRMMKGHFRKSRAVLEKYNLYAGQPPLLFLLMKEEGRRQKDIAKALNIQAATVTVTVKRLEKAGFVEKREDEKDKRISRLYLTDQGRDACINVREAMDNINMKAFNVLTEDEKIVFRNLTKKINNCAENEK